jgi:hypothetical protein
MPKANDGGVLTIDDMKTLLNSLPDPPPKKLVVAPPKTWERLWAIALKQHVESGLTFCPPPMQIGPKAFEHLGMEFYASELVKQAVVFDVEGLRSRAFQSGLSYVMDEAPPGPRHDEALAEFTRRRREIEALHQPGAAKRREVKGS